MLVFAPRACSADGSHEAGADVFRKRTRYCFDRARGINLIEVYMDLEAHAAGKASVMELVMAWEAPK
jgi:hypothetical protein